MLGKCTKFNILVLNYQLQGNKTANILRCGLNGKKKEKKMWFKFGCNNMG